MWFDIIKDNKRTQYYREFLEAAMQLGDLIDSPDNIKAYENFSGKNLQGKPNLPRPEYGLYSHGILFSLNFSFFCRASTEQTMVITKTLPSNRSVDAPGNNEQYNDFSVRMFMTEYPELYNKIWEFALFYNKIVNPNLLGREADKQRELFRSSRKKGSSIALLKDNLSIIYDFIEEFLYAVRDKMQDDNYWIITLNNPKYHNYDPVRTIIHKEEFIIQMATYPRIENAFHTSKSHTLKIALNKVAPAKTLTAYILMQWITLINHLTQPSYKSGNPNIKNVQLRHIDLEGTLFYNDWFTHHHDKYVEGLKTTIEEWEDTPEEDLGGWEDDDDGDAATAWTPQHAQDDDDDDDDEINALFA